MPAITIVFGLVLCGLSLFTVFVRAGGVAEVFANVAESFKPGTWLIPAGFGVVFVLLGVLSKLKPNAKKHFMHGAALVGTVGTLLCLGQGINQLRKLFSDQEVNMLAFGMVWSMAIVCLTFVGVCVQSFRAARKARQAAESQGS
ncbi:MAG: hypothetical protein ACK5PB_22685 [Pirellula sp.]|jgi:hypothetical protein